MNSRFGRYLDRGYSMFLEVNIEQIFLGLITLHFENVLFRRNISQEVLESECPISSFILVHHSEAEEINVDLGFELDGIPIRLAHVEVITLLQS
jgi:hypothetical protein